MSEDQPTARLTLPQPLMVVIALAAGIVVGMIFLLLSSRTAGAAILPPLTSPISAATTTLGDVVSSAPNVVATTVSSADPLAITATSAGSSVSQLVDGGSGVVTSLAGPIGLSGAVATPPISALPVLTSPAPLVLGDVVNQGPQTTSTSEPVSVGTDPPRRGLPHGQCGTLLPVELSPP